MVVGLGLLLVNRDWRAGGGGEESGDQLEPADTSATVSHHL